MSKHVFYLSAPFVAGDRLCLDGAEAAHARAQRLRPGEDAEIFDGQGAIARCRTLKADKRDFELEILDITTSPEPAARAVMALALSKAVRRGFFMEKAAELGCAEVWLWQGRNSVGRIAPATLAACRAQLVSGGKQSRNPWFPQLKNAGDLEGLLRMAASVDWRVLPWEDQDRRAMLSPSLLGRKGTTVYVLGPEGGLAAEEVDALANAGFEPVSLGKRVLRCETAATLCLGLHMWAAELNGNGN